MSGDMDLYISLAAGLEESGWSTVLSALDKDTLAKVAAELEKLQNVAETKEEEVADDPSEAIKQLNSKMTKMIKEIKTHRKRFIALDQRLKSIEDSGGVNGGASLGLGLSDVSSGGGGGKSKPRSKKQRKLKLMAKKEAEEKEDKDTAARKITYRFGSRNITTIRPTEGYPDSKEIKMKPQGSLELFHAHGYHGQKDEDRNNLYLSKDGKELIYYIAAVGVVYDYENDKQRFFKKHNDDITCICVDPREGSTLVASGQTDPKDVPGQGKDWPKIWVWDYKTMKSVQLIDNVCWGKVLKVGWSNNGTLYMVGGDPDHTIKAWDSSSFKGKGNPKDCLKMNTTKDRIFGFTVCPKPAAGMHDELVFYGTNKFYYLGLSKGKKGLMGKFKSVATTQYKEDGEKAFVCCEFLPDGTYAVGGASGCIYIVKGNTCLGVVRAHTKCVGDLVWDNKDKRLITSGFDKTLKKFALGGGSSGGAATTKTPKKNTKTKDKKRPKTPSGGGGSLLTEQLSRDVDIPNSDFILQPKAMCYDENTGKLFVGTKTNQIMKYNFNNPDDSKEPCASVIVDGHDGAIWGLCTHPEEPLFATGGFDNAIKVWDAESRECIFTYEFELAQGEKKGKEVRCAAWSNDGGCLVFGTEDSYIGVFKWDSKNRQCEFQQMIEIPPKKKGGAVEEVVYLRFNEDSTLLAAAHMDSNLYLYSVDGGAGGRYVLQQWDPLQHVAAPTHVQFSDDGSMIKTITRDYEVCHWKLNAETRKGTFITRMPDPDKFQWGGDPLIAGWDVQGLYQSGWDGTDLNDATLTSDKKLIITGDDYGTVRLHNYPAVDPNACAEYGGHCQFVVGVELLRDDSQLITCGGDDMAIFQWKVHKKE